MLHFRDNPVDRKIKNRPTHQQHRCKELHNFASALNALYVLYVKILHAMNYNINLNYLIKITAIFQHASKLR